MRRRMLARSRPAGTIPATRVCAFLALAPVALGIALAVCRMMERPPEAVRVIASVGVSAPANR